MRQITGAVACEGTHDEHSPVHEREAEHTIRCEGIYLRPVSSDDLDGYKRLMSDANVMRLVGLKAGEVPTADEITELLAGAVGAWEIRGWGRWSVFHGRT